MQTVECHPQNLLVLRSDVYFQICPGLVSSRLLKLYV